MAPEIVKRMERRRFVLTDMLFLSLAMPVFATSSTVLQAAIGYLMLPVHGKFSKVRQVPLHSGAAEAITAYLKAAGHGENRESALFLPTSNNARSCAASITPDGVYRMLAGYAKALQIDMAGCGPHALRVAAAANALDHGADIAEVQEWLGHAYITTTRVYDRRRSRPADSPTFKIIC